MKKLVILLMLFVHLTSCEEKNEPSTFEEDQATLDAKYDRIVELSEEEPCTNPNEWLSAPLGSKPCGGPWSYIPYHEDIDTTAFLQLVEEYTQFNESMNDEWNLTSDCAFVSPPNAIICENGKAVLVY